MAALALGASLASAADYQADLGPMPLDDETKAVIAGRGKATASFARGMLTVRGVLRGLPSAEIDLRRADGDRPVDGGGLQAARVKG